MFDTPKKQFIRDCGIVILSLIAAVFAIRYQAPELLLRVSRGSTALASFFSGIFFTSIFTTAPATAILGELAQKDGLLVVAFFGAVGSVIGDLVVFHFVRHHVTRDFEYVVNKIRREENWLARHRHFLELKAMRWIIPLIGALVIASPLPDEYGIALLGISKIKMPGFIIISFVLNFLGILVIGLVARLIS